MDRKDKPGVFVSACKDLGRAVATDLRAHGLKVLVIDADTDDHVKELRDINKAREGIDFFIYTSSITVGINYVLEHFHHLFVHTSSCSNMPRDSVQGTALVRTLPVTTYF